MSLKTIEFESFHKKLSHLSGLIFFQRLIHSLGLEGRLATILPKDQIVRNLKHKEKFLLGIYSFICGADCLDDIGLLRLDPLFSKVTKGGCDPRTMGIFLKRIPLKSFQKLQQLLPELSYKLRQRLYPRAPLIISMDATDHVQHGQQMEGVGWNYKDHWCLDTQNAFDQFGFCYGWSLRAGGTHSSKGAVEMIESIFRNVRHTGEKYYLADSAYSTMDIYNSLIAHKVNFVICLKENVWSSILKNYGNKIKWQKSNLYFFKSNKCEVGSCLYAPKGLKEKSFLRVVFVRAKKEKLMPGDKEYYRYYSVVTNISTYDLKDRDVMRFYTKRGNCENFIKDLKYGMDFKHFPCQTMIANRSWGMMGIIAYNLMRFAAHRLYPHRGCFLKKVRNKVLYIASELRTGQRKVKLLMTQNIYQEVKYLECMMTTQLGFYRSGYGGQSPPS